MTRSSPDCVFCRIVAGEHPAHVVLDDEVVVAFLDRRPLFHGHTLLVPRDHLATLADVPDELLEPMFARVRQLSHAIPEAMEKSGSFVAMNNVVSQSVPHLHVHVVPRRPRDGLKGFFWPRTSYETDAEMRDAAERIRAALAGRPS